jgi:hypothetical protein
MCEIQLVSSSSGFGTVGSKWHDAVRSDSATSAWKKGGFSGALELLRNVNRTVAKSRQLCSYGAGRVGEVE